MNKRLLIVIIVPVKKKNLIFPEFGIRFLSLFLMKCNFNFLFSRLPGGVQLLLLQDPLLGLPAALLLLVLPTSLLQFSVLRLQVLFHLLVTPLELRGHGGTVERLTERQPEREKTHTGGGSEGGGFAYLNLGVSELLQLLFDLHLKHLLHFLFHLPHLGHVVPSLLLHLG